MPQSARRTAATRQDPITDRLSISLQHTDDPTARQNDLCYLQLRHLPFYFPLAGYFTEYIVALYAFEDAPIHHFWVLNPQNRSIAWIS